MAISLSYWYLMVQNDSYTWPLKFSGQEWQFDIPTDINDIATIFTLLLTYSSQEWQFHIATDI